MSSIIKHERFSEPDPLPEGVDAVAEMKHLLRTKKVEPFTEGEKAQWNPFLASAVMGFRQFMLRGVELVAGEWSLVCIAWNLKRIHSHEGLEMEKLRFDVNPLTSGLRTKWDF